MHLKMRGQFYKECYDIKEDRALLDVQKLHEWNLVQDYTSDLICVWRIMLPAKFEKQASLKIPEV
jgi:hypothetical protein